MTEEKEEVYLTANADGKRIYIKIPLCCQEGRDDCPHSPQVTKTKKRRNIGV